MRRMTSDAPIGLHWSMLVNKRALLVRVTLDAGGVSAGGEACLFEFKTAVRIVAVAALHRAFQHLVMERQVELVLGFAMATEAKLWLAFAEQLQIRKPGLLRVCLGNEDVRSRELPASWLRVGRVAVGASDVVAPVFAAAEVVVFLAAGVTTQTRLGDLFRRLVFERDDLRWVAFFDVRLTWTMARLATRHLFFPTAELRELRVRSVREVFELIFVAVFTRVATDEVVRFVSRGFGLSGLRRV